MFPFFRRKNKATNNFLSGTWKGEYTYGENYPAEYVHNLPVPFIIKLHQKGKKIKGICVDEETKDLFAKPASIKGTFKKGQLEFVKLYPSMWTQDERGEVIVYPHVLSHSIHYFGKLEDNCLQGHWVIPLTYTNEAGGQMNEWYKGTWYMTKETE